jgi:cell division protein FtsB
MFDFYQKRKLRTVFTSPVTRVVLFILAIFISWSAFERYQIAKDMEHRREQVEAEVAKLKAQKETLSAEVEYLQDERGIEAEMRRQFDVALEGEQVVVIVEPEPAEINASSTPYKEEDQAWYEFWR